MYYRDQLFIDGQWSTPDSGTAIDVISPHSQEVIGRVSFAGPADVDRAVQAARTAFDGVPWPRMQPAERIAAVTRLAELYKEHRGDMAELITAEIGAPISFAKRAQVRIPLMMFSAFCDLAGRYDWQEARPGLYGNDIRILKQPVGVVAAVVPWNMPQLHNLEWDPAEEHGVGFPHAWVLHPVAAAAGAFLKTLVVEPPIKPGTPDPYTPPKPGDFVPQTHLQIGPIMQYITTLVAEHDEPPDPSHGIEHQSG